MGAVGRNHCWLSRSRLKYADKYWNRRETKPRQEIEVQRVAALEQLPFQYLTSCPLSAARVALWLTGAATSGLRTSLWLFGPSSVWSLRPATDSLDLVQPHLLFPVYPVYSDLIEKVHTWAYRLTPKRSECSQGFFSRSQVQLKQPHVAGLQCAFWSRSRLM